MERITPTELRANIYKIIDRVIATGEPCEVVREGYVLEVKLKTSRKRGTSGKVNDLSKVVPIPDLLVEDPEFYRHIEWNAWQPKIDL